MFDFLFKRKAAHPTPAAQPAPPSPTQDTGVAPGTQLHFDASLVTALISDHRYLLAMFKEITEATSRRDAGVVSRVLAQFGDALRGHILKENIRLYVYLKHSLQGDEDSTAIMHQFSREMHHIGLAVTDFLTRYTGDRNWDDAQWSVFERDLNQVGGVLTRRIETEESILYPLYLPPGDYA